MTGWAELKSVPCSDFHVVTHIYNECWKDCQKERKVFKLATSSVSSATPSVVLMPYFVLVHLLFRFRKLIMTRDVSSLVLSEV